MWLCTQHGFYSIVLKTPGEFHVRARLKRDLENLRALLVHADPGGTASRRAREWIIHRSTNADYRWRLVVTQPDVIMMMAALGDSIDYSNFKNRIHTRADQCDKSIAYGNLWADLHALQR